MLLWLALFLASTVTAAPAGESKTTKDGSELLRREKSEDVEQPRRATMPVAYSLTEEQLRAAHSLGRAMAKQPKHEQERLVNLLHTVIEHAESRIQEHRRKHPNDTGPVSLVEEDEDPDRGMEFTDTMDDAPNQQWSKDSIRSASPESLTQESAGWVPPPGWNVDGSETQKWREVASQRESMLQQKEQHPPAAGANGLSQYWSNVKNDAKGNALPSYFTKETPELPPDLSAYEKDNYEGNTGMSEYFGPFRLDYSYPHTITLNGWNFIVSSPMSKPGLGNVMIGPDNFVNDATNSFIVGLHNTARGEFNALVAGENNEAEGEGNVVVGGEENIAEGVYSNVAGGYRDEAAGYYTVASGGAMNVATGNFAVVAGGQNNLAAGAGSSITGGRGNEAVGILSSINGGAGNKAGTNHSTVVGGVGQETEEPAAAIFHQLDDHDKEEVASKDFSKSHHGGAAWSQSLNVDYAV